MKGDTLPLHKLPNGKEITLSGGRGGLRHILERHLPSYFKGVQRGAGKDTLFPHGTTPADIVDIVGEAAKKAPPNIDANGTFKAVLRNGKEVEVILDNYSIKSVYPARTGDGFGWDLNAIASQV